MDCWMRWLEPGQRDEGWQSTEEISSLNNLSTPCTLWPIVAMPLSSDQGCLEATEPVPLAILGCQA